jgi:hypothetical protein
MPIRNTIKLISFGTFGIVDWSESPEKFIEKLEDVESSVITKISDDKLLISVSGNDSRRVTDEFRINPYISPKNCLPTTSILINHKLTEEEENHVNRIIKILVSNGSIKGSGVNIRVHDSTNKTFVNFSHKSESDRDLLKAFIGYLC